MGWIAVLIAAGVMTFGATALAEGKDGKDGCTNRGQARFQKFDKNSDGFLTAAEIGDKKWARIKVADTNADAKVSFAELKQARADGKVGKTKRGKKGKKRGDA